MILDFSRLSFPKVTHVILFALCRDLSYRFEIPSQWLGRGERSRVYEAPHVQNHKSMACPGLESEPVCGGTVFYRSDGNTVMFYFPDQLCLVCNTKGQESPGSENFGCQPKSWGGCFTFDLANVVTSQEPRSPPSKPDKLREDITVMGDVPRRITASVD